VKPAKTICKKVVSLSGYSNAREGWELMQGVINLILVDSVTS